MIQGDATVPQGEERPSLGVPKGVLSAQDMQHWQSLANGVEGAERHASRLRDAASAAWRLAKADGHAIGRTEGMKEGALLLRRAVESLRATESALSEEIGVIALEVVRRLLGDIEEVRLVPALVRTALDTRSGGAVGRLRVSPPWAQRLSGIDLGFPVEPDPDLAPGQFLLDLAEGVRDIGVEAQLATIEAAFRSVPAGIAEVAT